MLISSIIGFAVVGVIASAVLTRFWDSIKNWLNTVAADAVEKHFGYSWRNKIIKAVAFVDRVHNKLLNKAVVYTKDNPQDTYFNKTTVTDEASIDNIDDDILEENKKNNNHIHQEFTYNS